ncbi:hypothetical protein AAMO2058_001543300 [Amorphochlora amoebiformis]|mmetsp:Transcript_4344/g.6599  ORF Transcript_4344/g.6599 Transcript_4344/m.6599 type:complete len:314 (-) Transcript_4344:177-1118(-)
MSEALRGSKDSASCLKAKFPRKNLPLKRRRIRPNLAPLQPTGKKLKLNNFRRGQLKRQHLSDNHTNNDAEKKLFSERTPVASPVSPTVSKPLGGTYVWTCSLGHRVNVRLKDMQACIECPACINGLQTATTCLRALEGKLDGVECLLDRRGYVFTIRCKRDHQWKVPCGPQIRKYVFFKSWCGNCERIEKDDNARKQRELLEAARRRMTNDLFLKHPVSPPTVQALANFPEILKAEHKGELSQETKKIAVAWVLSHRNNPFHCLGVNEGSSDKIAKTHYRRLAIATHPDKNKSGHAAEAFKLLVQAYKVVCKC